MSYKIRWDPKSIETLKKLDNHISKRIVNKVGSIVEQPYVFIKRLSGESLFKLRVGDYRVLLEIDEHAKEIIIRFLDHRSRIYKILNRSS